MSRRLLGSVITLAVGSGLAQLVMLAFAPLLSRLYTPADYACQTVFLTIVGTVLPFVCAKYEVAIVVAGTERHAVALRTLSLRIAIGVSMALAAIVVVLRQPIETLVHGEALGRWLYAVPVAVLMGAVALIDRHMANRCGEYAVISRFLLLQALLSCALNLALGWQGMGADGLLVANVVSVTIGTAWLSWRMRSLYSGGSPPKTWSLRAVARKYRSFPLYNASSSVLDSLTLALPVFFLARLTDSDTVGQYGFLMRFAQAPLALVSGAVTQVHLKHVADMVRAGVPVRPYLARITAILAGLVAVPTLCAMLWGGPLFAWTFGQRWQTAGEYLAILMPSLALQFVVSTLSPTCGATGNNRVAALWKALSFVVTLGMFLAVAPLLDTRALLWAIASTNVALYVLYYLAIWYAAGRPRGNT
ncbi:MAG: hypothetical protein EBR10_05145 [Planctomycetes bacterium]|nr:hypothetical protein [Planctomycetota bacterium]